MATSRRPPAAAVAVASRRRRRLWCPQAEPVIRNRTGPASGLRWWRCDKHGCFEHQLRGDDQESSNAHVVTRHWPRRPCLRGSPRGFRRCRTAARARARRGRRHMAARATAPPDARPPALESAEGAREGAKGARRGDERALLQAARTTGRQRSRFPPNAGVWCVPSLHPRMLPLRWLSTCIRRCAQFMQQFMQQSMQQFVQQFL